MKHTDDADLQIRCLHEYIDDEVEITIKYSIGQTNKQKYIKRYKTDAKEPKDIQRRHTKNNMKLFLYEVLEDYTGRSLDWGTLTGIRPVRIVHALMDNNLNELEVLSNLHRDYRISPQKSQLILDIAKTQRLYFKDNHSKRISVYVNIPICKTKCLFCSFPSDTIDNCSHLIDDYVTTLIKEMEIMSRWAKDKDIEVESIYVGGGTPTSLNIFQLERVLKAIEDYWGHHQWMEYTVEGGRPDTMDSDKLKLMKDYNVTRISINPQTMSPDTLKTIGRGHTMEEIVHCFYLAKDMGFHSINMDVIVGLPGEGIDDVVNTMKSIRKLNPDNLTVHTLAIKRTSILKDKIDDYQFVNQEKASEMMKIFYDGATYMGMRPYYLYRQKYMLGNMENIGFALPSKESIYNMQIMENRQSIWAFGAAAITRIYDSLEDRIDRVPNVKNIEEYINRIDEMVDRKVKSIF